MQSEIKNTKDELFDKGLFIGSQIIDTEPIIIDELLTRRTFNQFVLGKMGRGKHHHEE